MNTLGIPQNVNSCKHAPRTGVINNGQPASGSPWALWARM